VISFLFCCETWDYLNLQELLSFLLGSTLRTLSLQSTVTVSLIPHISPSMGRLMSAANPLADSGDYIPSKGFIYKPDLVWPPPPSKECGLEQVLLGEDGGQVVQLYEQVQVGFQLFSHLSSRLSRLSGTLGSPQMYCPNNLMDHPLVSPVNQGSLGGLCPLYIVSSLSSAYLSRQTFLMSLVFITGCWK